MEPDIRNLLIDFGGVLVGLDRARCVDRFRQLGVGEVERLLTDYRQQGFFLQYELGTVSTDDFRAHIRGLVKDRSLTDAEIDDAWNSFLTGIPHERLSLLLELRKRYRVCLLSNTNELHWQWACVHAFPWEGHGTDDYFDRIYLSYKMHRAKPDAEMFRLVMADAGMNPAETFFIDDSAENCRAARALGVRTYTPEPHEDWSHLFRD